jgi:Tfp pilus assembly protein PilF
MRKLLLIAVLGVILPAVRGAEPKWIRMPSADFEIYSSAGEGDTRRALQYLERVRSFFEQALGGGAGQKREPVRVIVFGSKKEYEQYRPNDFAAAYYTQIAGRDYIVLGSVNDEAFPIAVHEYVHLVTQNVGMKFPPWLNEGIAEIFSTLKPTGDKVIVGTPILGRMQEMSREKWVPLAAIVAADHDSPYYNEKNKAGSLYNEGWALAHMLELSSQYSPRFGKFLEEMQKGTPSQKAIEGVWGKPLETVEKDLQAYLRSDTFNARLISVKLQNGEKVAAEPAVMFDVKLTLLDLSNRRGKEADAKAEFQDLIKEDPKRPEPYVALGYLAARGREEEPAIESFGKAVELGSRNPQMLWDFGRMAARAKPQQAMGALETLLADQPNRFEVRFALAQIQMNSKLAKEAIETLAPVKKVTAEDAPRFFQILAFAHLQNGEREAARTNAQRWLDNTKDTDEKLNANRMLRYLDQQDAPAARPASAAQSSPPPLPRLDKLDGGDAGDSTPKLVRAEPPAPEGAPARLELPSVSGTLVELDCKGSLPKFVLQAEGGRVSLLMDDPKSVLISGLAEGTIDLNCGPLKHVAVWIQYDPPTAAAPGVKGIVRAIHYEPEPGKLKAR